MTPTPDSSPVAPAQTATDPACVGQADTQATRGDRLDGSPVYQGQFGEFTIEEKDRQEVIFYRAGLGLAAASFAVATGLVLWQADSPLTLALLTPLYGVFWLGLGVSLFYIHIYLAVLHRALQAFWLIGGLAAVVIAIASPQPLALQVHEQPLLILGVGFTFAALTGIFFKEAFCFNRLETKALTPLVPLLLLGHLGGLISPGTERLLLLLWSFLFVVFALRKAVQEIPADIGDKSVFDYLKAQVQS